MAQKDFPHQLQGKALPHVKKVVTGLPDLKIKHEGICKGCAKGKNIKNPFPKSETQTKGTLELIHSDVCGPMSSTSLSGFDYYITFIDDFSRKTWIYFLKAKSEVSVAKFLWWLVVDVVVGETTVSK